MSRTRHRKAPEDHTRQSSRPRMTRSQDYYSLSVYHQPSNKGKPGAWQTWIRDQYGYRKEMKRRKFRTFLKVLGRRRERRWRKVRL